MAPTQARDQGKLRTMVERGLGMTAVPQKRAASPGWSKRREASGEYSFDKKRRMIDSITHFSKLRGVL